MTMKALWAKLAHSKTYRAQFVSSQARRAFAFQLRAIMKKRGISQEKLAAQSGLTQGVISRAADPSYGKLTTTVIVKIANGLDMAYLGVLVPFSDAARWFCDLSEESVQVANFDEESKRGELEASKRRLPSDRAAADNLIPFPKSLQREDQVGGILGEPSLLPRGLKNFADQNVGKLGEKYGTY